MAENKMHGIIVPKDNRYAKQYVTFYPDELSGDGSGSSSGGATKRQTEIPEDGMLPNVFYDLGVIGNTAFELNVPEDTSNALIWYFTFDTKGSGRPPTITFPTQITHWIGGVIPTILLATHYEISIVHTANGADHYVASCQTVNL